jgi:hypothetical protein
MSINPAHITVLCLVLFVVLLGLVVVRQVLAVVAVVLQQVLLFAGIVAACAVVVVIAAAARAGTVTTEPMSRPDAVTVREATTSTWAARDQVAPGNSLSVARVAFETEGQAGPENGPWHLSMPGEPAAGGFFAILLISFLILAVAFSQLMSAVLPILIIVFLVPAQDRAALADLIAAMGRTSRFGMWSALRAAMAARKGAQTSQVKGSATGDDHCE